MGWLVRLKNVLTLSKFLPALAGTNVGGGNIDRHHFNAVLLAQHHGKRAVVAIQPAQEVDCMPLLLHGRGA